MKKVICKVADGLLILYSGAGVIFLLLVIVTTFLQVATRYFLEASFSWTEEGARYAFIWMSMMGASLATRHGSNATIDVLNSFLKGGIKRVHGIAIQLLVLLAALMIIPQGIQMVRIMMMRSSPALNIPMGYVYIAIPLGCIGIAVQCLANLSVLAEGEKEVV